MTRAVSLRGLAAEAGDAGLKPGVELPGGQIEKNADPLCRGASDIVRPASCKRNGVKPQRVRAREH